MREILFRGKTARGERWAFGSLFVDHNGGCQIWEKDEDHSIHNYIVIPETVGQYTGLKDNNGTKIFEGDILISPMERYYHVTFDAGSFVAQSGLIYYTKDIWHYGAVIGNIHDNPELLK